MPDKPMESDCLEQRAVLWAKTGYDNYGSPTVSTVGEEIDVRWENKVQDVLDPQGNTISADATVVVDQDITVGSQMWEGKLQDIPGTQEIPTSDIREVIAFSKVPDIKGRNVRRVAMLKRLSDTLSN